MKTTQRSALVLIDLQNGIFAGRGGSGQVAADRRLDALCGRLSRLAQRWVEGGRPLILVQHAGPQGHRLAVGGDGWALRPELDLPGAVVISKQACDAFHDTGLAGALAERRVDTLVIGGCMTEFCVDTSCRSAISRGYDVVLVADGHATVDGVVPAEAIIAHHNATLDGLQAGDAILRLAAAADIP